MESSNLQVAEWGGQRVRRCGVQRRPDGRTVPPARATVSGTHPTAADSICWFQSQQRSAAVGTAHFWLLHSARATLGMKLSSCRRWTVSIARRTPSAHSQSGKGLGRERQRQDRPVESGHALPCPAACPALSPPGEPITSCRLLHWAWWSPGRSCRAALLCQGPWQRSYCTAVRAWAAGRVQQLRSSLGEPSSSRHVLHRLRRPAAEPCPAAATRRCPAAACFGGRRPSARQLLRRVAAIQSSNGKPRPPKLQIQSSYGLREGRAELRTALWVLQRPAHLAPPAGPAAPQTMPSGTRRARGCPLRGRRPRQTGRRP